MTAKAWCYLDNQDLACLVRNRLAHPQPAMEMRRQSRSGSHLIGPAPGWDEPLTPYRPRRPYDAPDTGTGHTLSSGLTKAIDALLGALLGWDEPLTTCRPRRSHDANNAGRMAKPTAVVSSVACKAQRCPHLEDFQQVLSFLFPIVRRLICSSDR
jgi:hypothetical protein